MYCTKCGSEIKETDAFCAGCGSKIETNLQSSQPMQAVASVETICAPAKARKKNNVVIIITAFALILILSAAVIFLNPFQRTNQGYFRGTKWDMTIDEVKNAEKTAKLKPDVSDEKSIVYTATDSLGFEGTDKDIIYYFEDGKLDSAAILISDGTDDVTVDADELLRKYSKVYGKKYEHTNDEDGAERYTWVTPKSEVSIDLMKDGFSYVYYDRFGKDES